MSTLTFPQLLTCYLNSMHGRHSHRRYHQLTRRLLADPKWKDLHAAAVTRCDALLLKQSLARTPAQANKMLGMIKQAYNWASNTIDPSTCRPYYEGQNPVLGLKGFHCTSRERLMDKSEIALLLDSLDFLSLKYQAFFVTRLLTPCRITELCTMRRDAVDLVTGKWFKRLTKNGRPQWVLIPRQARELLMQLPEEGDYFFMGQYGHPIQPESVRKIWVRFRADLNMPDVQLLDFRRTLSSYLYTEIKADDLTAKAVLNHYDSRPVAIYTRLNYDRLASIIQAFADWMWSLKQKGGYHASTDTEPLSPEQSHAAGVQPTLYMV